MDNQQHDTKDLQSHDDLLRRIADGEAQIQIKSRLMENMAYQIRTLSNAVIGFSDLLLSEGLDQTQTDYVQEIGRAGYGLSSMVNEVLDWVGVLSGKLETEKTRCDLPEMLDRLEQILATAAKETELDHQMIRDPMLPGHIFTDEERLLRCLLNVVANAIRYTQKGSVRVHVALEERSTIGRAIRFDIIDSGMGIDPEHTAHLFEAQSDYQVCSDQGLLVLVDMGFRITAGLTLTKQLIECLGGSIEVKSEVGAGSTFSLRVPVGITPIATSNETEPEDKWVDTTQPAKPVLLVEDQQANRTVISLMLEALGAEVDTAIDGNDALSKVEQNAYSLILMDLKMPKMDGFEATRHLRSQEIDIPVVALSARVLDKEQHLQIKSLFDGFIMKPVDSQKLAEMLGEFVAGFHIPHRDDVVLEYGN